MTKLTAKALNNAMRKAGEESMRLDKALGLPHLEVCDGYLVRIDPNGKQTRLRKAVFGIRKIDRQVIKLHKMQ